MWLLFSYVDLTKFSFIRTIEIKFRQPLEEYSIAIPSMNFCCCCVDPGHLSG